MMDMSHNKKNDPDISTYIHNLDLDNEPIFPLDLVH
jgi:hypothetical protein